MGYNFQPVWEQIVTTVTTGPLGEAVPWLIGMAFGFFMLQWLVKALMK